LELLTKQSLYISPHTYLVSNTFRFMLIRQ
jgi:hypothetical protein